MLVRSLAVLALCAASMIAQTFYETVIGTISDASGAAVPEVNAILTNLGTGERRTQPTDSQGNYQFVNLLPGRYRVDIEKTGFKRVSRELTVEVQQSVRVDAALEVGDVSQSVEVSALAVTLQTENSTVGAVVESRKVLEMPLNGRNVMNLVALVPGVVPQGQAIGTPTGTNPFAWGNYQIGGGMANQSATFIDGAPINITYINLTSLVPTQDAIQEFKVETNALGPEFGRFAGGVINMVTRSGSNQFHGTAYEFLRNRVLNANTYFNNRGNVQRPAFTQNQYGGNIGGPIKKDKLFFFYGFEGFRLRQGQSFLTSVPSNAMRQGDFSGLPAIFDPLTTCGRLGNPACATNAAGAEVISRTPFPNNRIPADRFDRAARAMTNLWAPPTGPGIVNNFTANASVGGNNDQHNARGDYNISEKHRIFGRYTWWKNLNLPIDPYRTQTCVDRCTEVFVTQQAVLADTYSFSPTTILDVRAAFLRFAYDRTPLTVGYDLTQLGWPSSLNNSVFLRALPIPVVQGFTDVFGSQGTGSVILSRNDSYSVVPTLTKIAGKHTFRFGGEWRRLTHNYAQTNVPTGIFNFDALMTSQNPFATGGTGSGFASFLLGMGSSGNLGNPALVAGQQIYRALFFNDQWQVTRNLTLNLGIRFDQMGPWSERFDRMTVLSTRGVNPLVNRPGRLDLVNSDAWDSRNNWRLGNLWQPRVGIAYRLNNKTVLRAGGGLFFLPPDVVFNMAPNLDAVNSISTLWNSTTDGSVTPADRLSNPFPNGILAPPGRNPNYQRILLGQNVNAPIPTDPYARALQWNVSLQRDLGAGVIVDAAYAGSKGTHLPVTAQQLNQLDPQFLSLGAQLQQQVENPFFGIVGTGPLSARTVARGQLLRPFPQYLNFQQIAGNNRNSSYHSLQMQVRKRFSGGGSITAAYTFAKLLSNTDTLTGWLESGGGFGQQNWYNAAAEKAPSLYDATHRLVVSYIYDLPFGKGQKFGSGVGGFAGKVISGWGLNGVSTFQSGFPLGLSMAVNQTNSFGGGARPNWTGVDPSLDGAAQSRLTRWFDTSQFSAPPAFTFGNMARSILSLRSHGQANYDFTLFKNTNITERVGLQFRTEVFNLFNRVQFAYPGRALGNPQFGVISGQANNPRLVQFALRLVF